MGDGMLAEFPSVVVAVCAAVETQLAVAEPNSGLPEAKRIEFRASINLGDVIIDGDDCGRLKRGCRNEATACGYAY